VIVSEEPIADTAVDSFPTPTPLGILYREAELEELGSGDAEKGLEHVLAAFADDPQAVEFGAVKPANTDPDTAPIVAIDPSEIPATSAANQSIIDAMPTPTTEGGAFALFLALELDAMERGLSTPEQSTETLADLFGNRDIGQD
jgi:hypothetical protein